MEKKQGKRKIDGVVEEIVERERVVELIETPAGEVKKIVHLTNTQIQDEQKRGGKVGPKQKVVDVTQTPDQEKIKGPEIVKGSKVVHVTQPPMREKHRGHKVGKGIKVRVFCFVGFPNIYKGPVLYCIQNLDPVPNIFRRKWNWMRNVVR